MPSRIFLIRNGETEWSLKQQHTGSIEIPLTPNGEKQVQNTAAQFVGDGVDSNKLIQRCRIGRVYCSPRFRARQTLALLNLGANAEDEPAHADPGIIITDLRREWDYGVYEGLTPSAVREIRTLKGLDQIRSWNIWKDGCEGGESPQEVSARLDRLISEIQQFLGSQSYDVRGGEPRDVDIVCVAHGHILSALALRWAEQPLENGMRLLTETAGVGTLCYDHDSVDEPAVMLGARP
ncbi:histidine phosphatase superfamily [Aspergillus bertholletiae]|uniref:Histidine phosphatase superfamily n=1 Tax=Aspergillus bertholletiae TaxID=1226010 RepID=A0A5N7BQ37_9EURO|nr:histidine phosphatase superfamily [Aspergillus bertholletiae]